MAAIRCEIDLYRVSQPGNNFSFTPLKSGNTIVGWKLKNGHYTTSYTIAGQKRTYTDGVLTDSLNFTLASGDGIQTPTDLASVAATMTFVLASEADPANWHPDLVKIGWSGYSLTCQTVTTGTE